MLFGLVLLLIAGWAVEPLARAATVTILPLAALAGARCAGDAACPRAAAGCLLVGGGVLALAWLPSASVAWTFAPQALAGIGMGMALPAFAGELLPERTAREAARLLTIRHVGIALVLIALAPLIAHRLDVVTEHAQEQGVALVLDAKLPPQDKLTLAPALLGGVEAERPRAGLRTALADNGRGYTGEERTTYDQLAQRADDVLVSAVGDAFRIAFVIAGGAGAARRGRVGGSARLEGAPGRRSGGEPPAALRARRASPDCRVAYARDPRKRRSRRRSRSRTPARTASCPAPAGSPASCRTARSKRSTRLPAATAAAARSWCWRSRRAGREALRAAPRRRSALDPSILGNLIIPRPDGRSGPGRAAT